MKYLIFFITFIVLVSAGFGDKMIVQQEEPGFFDGIVDQFNDYLTQAEDWFNWLLAYVQGALGM